MLQSIKCDVHNVHVCYDIVIPSPPPLPRQISYIDDCDDVDDLMGAEWVCHKEAWQSLWQLAESCVEHNRRKRPSSMTVSIRAVHVYNNIDCAYS